MNVGICISVRMNSKRLPGKAMLKIAGKPSLYWLCNQLKNLPIKTVVCHSTNPLDVVISQFCEEHNIDHFAGSEENVLERFVQAATIYEFTHIIRITGDDLFVDPDYVAKALNIYSGCEYATTDMPKGTDFQIIDVQFLRKLLDKSSSNTEYLTYLLETSDSKQLIRISPDSLITYSFELDDEEDKNRIEKMINDLWDNNYFKVSELLRYAKENDGLFEKKSVV